MKKVFPVAVCVSLLIGLAVGCGGTSNPAQDAIDDATDDVVQVESKIRLNEIDCHGTDWIEIVNVGDMVADLAGWIVTDGLDKTDHYYPLPAGSIVRPGGYLVVKGASETREGFDFGIKCDDESVFLMDQSKKVIDVTDVTAVPDGFTWGRNPDGTGNFTVTLPTQGTANVKTPDTPAELFDPEVVNLFEITLGSDAVSALTSDPYEYVSGVVSVTVAGRTVSGQPVGVRLKSGYSFQPLTGKAAFKIRADGYAVGDRILGMKNFTLNNMVDDRTMLHETLAYKLFREAGLPAPRTGYAQVRVNGQDYGLYVLVENYDDQFTTLNFASTQHLYEGTGDLYAGQIGKFDVEDGDKLDVTDLEKLMERVAASTSGWHEGVSEVADMPSMVKLWAIEAFIAHTDGYSMAANNFFLHSDDDGVFTMLPWGTDRTFVDTPTFDSCTSVFCTSCFADTVCAGMMQGAFESLPALVASAGLDDMITSVSAAIASNVESDPRKPFTMEEHDAAVQALKAWLDARLTDVAD